jgi:hypothetical protein
MTESATSVYYTNQLVLVAGIINGVHFQNHTKYKTALCLKNAEVNYVAADGTYVYHWALSRYCDKNIS